QYAGRPCEEETAETTLRRRRLASPPVVYGGLVLLIPVDRNELLAFSVIDGTVRWSVPLGDSSYIIAAADSQSSNLRLWLGGPYLRCLSVPTGETIWTQEVGAVQTGRSVLSGTALYVPTWEGLISFDAETGVRIGVDSVPGSHEPLGNLLCIGSALFSSSPASIRRFPDVAGAYPQALARYEADPTDVRAAAELGWIELLRGHAQRAYEVVRDVDATAWPPEDRRSFDLSHVRVEALLAMADQAVDSPSQTLHHLTEATRIAGTPEDRLRCGLALARRLSTIGRHAQAYRQFLRVGWGRHGKRLMPVDDSVDATARFAVSRHLASLLPKLDDDERAALRDFVGEHVAQAVASLPQRQGQRTAEDALRATVDLDPIGAASKTALLALGNLKLTQLRYAQAEQLLLGCARRSVDAATAIRALMKLFDLYATPWQEGADAQAKILDRLASHYGDAVVPDRPDETVGAWAEQAREQLALWETAPLSLTGNLAWSPIFEQEQPDRNVQGRRGLRQRAPVRNPAPALVDFGPDVPTVLARRIVLVDAGGVVRCHGVDTGDELWRAPLRFAEEFRDEIPRRATTPVDPRLRRAVAYGQIGVFHTGDALYAIGLASGKRIWIRPCEEPGLSSATVAQGSDPTGSSARRDLSMAVGPGWLVATPKAGRLTMMNLLDGETIWERDLRGETVDSVRVYGSTRIVTLDAKLQRVHIFDPADGRLIRRVIFRQPYRDVEQWAQQELRPPSRINIVEAHGAAREGKAPAEPSATSDTAQEQGHTGGVLCGPTSSPLGDSVLAVDLTSGETLWEMLQPKPLTQLLELHGEGLSSSGYIGIALLGGDFRIVDAATGEVVFDRNIPRIREVIDAVLHQGTILVRHLAPDDSEVAITAIDVATGAEVWHRAGLAPIGAVTMPLRVIGGRIPLVLDGGFIQGQRKPLRLAVIDVRTGGEIGSVVELGVTSTNLRGYRGIDLEIRRGVVVVGTPIGIFPFATESAPISSEGDS
ncbi:MAG: PQQ-binding-like beta-propeller repeat protein, partial [Planctomycetes bacterium]|nr:PQQ-binding-like beta-propeller repeat protein [Planctomycetota bacterium]